MTQPSSLHLDLQCTGVTPAPTGASPRLPTTSLPQDPLRDPQAECRSREPLHDSNSQTSPCGSSSQKRLHTTSESFAVTPSEKRGTMLALSPQQPLGQQFDTLEMQRVLSLTPGKKPDFGHSPTRQGTQGGHPACGHSSPGSTAPASTSPASHKQSDSTRQQTVSPWSTSCEDPPDAPHLLRDTCPATEPQLADIPPTQPVCAPSAQDLVKLQPTQVVMTDAGAAGTCQPNPAVHCNECCAQYALRHPSGPAMACKHACGRESTPMLHLPATVQDTEAVPHGRAPAGPLSSPSPLLHSSTHSRQAAQAAKAPTTTAPSTITTDGNQPAGQANVEPRVVNPAATARASQTLSESSPEPVVHSAQLLTCNEPGGQQSQLQSRCHPEPAVAMPAGTAPSLDPSSPATSMDTQDASLSQVSIRRVYQTRSLLLDVEFGIHCRLPIGRLCCKSCLCCCMYAYSAFITIQMSLPGKNSIWSGMSYCGAVSSIGSWPDLMHHLCFIMKHQNAGCTFTALQVDQLQTAHTQESLDGTQAEADALMEEAAKAFMHGASDEAEGCLLLNVSTTTIHEVVGALGRPYHTWRSQVPTAL